VDCCFFRIGGWECAHRLFILSEAKGLHPAKEPDTMTLSESAHKTLLLVIAPRLVPGGFAFCPLIFMPLCVGASQRQLL
jgi:hypothetical protein